MKIAKFKDSIKGLSANTQNAYTNSLAQLEGSIGAQGDQRRQPTLEEVKTFLMRYARSPATLQRHKAAIKAYFDWADLPWKFNRRQFPPRKRRVPRFLDPEVVEEIIETAGEDHPRDQMFLRTLFTLALRISEVLRIEEENITDAGVVLVTKGGDEYLTPATPEFIEELRTFARGKNGRLFPAPYSYYYRLIKYLGYQVGHPEISPHFFRHSRAVDLLRKTKDISFVQQMLHHADISTTAIYTQITGGHLADQLIAAEKNEKGKS